jgi:L-aminopeptidase/D-esterase-like protein
MGDSIPRRQFLTVTAGSTLVAALDAASGADAEKGADVEQGADAEKGAAAGHPQTNDHLSLTPVTQVDGPFLDIDFPAVHIGVSEYPQGPTGCTVFYFPDGVTAAVDVRGGAPGTIWTDQLHEGDGFLQAICLAGGSLYGLEAATGVSAELFARCGYATDWDHIAAVSGAVIFDFHPRSNAIYPDKALGRAALAAAKPGRFPLGRHGAGCSASVGGWLRPPFQSESSGQGAAFRKIGDTKIAVFTVVNCLGAIVDRKGQVVRGHLDPRTGQRMHITDLPPLASPRRGNTCLTVVVTNQQLSPRLLRQLARQVHASMARAVEPFHTPVDGDVLFCVTTHEVPGKDVNEFVLAAAASELAWDSVLSSVRRPS